jgi:hypothetical protein
MRKFLIPAAAALASTFAIATPAAAQYYPGQQYGYQQNAYGYQNGYSYQNAYGQTQALQARVARVRVQIRELDRRNLLSSREARGLDRQAAQLQWRIQRVGWNGVNWNERRDVEVRLAGLERRVQREAMDGNGRYGNRYGYNNGYGYSNGYGYNQYDRDRDGRDDRYEDDRGSDHDD